MARLVQKSGYIKNGKASGYMEYVATRDGVEIIQSTESATKKQKQFIKRLLKDFPDAKELFEYSDYLQTPNRGTASAFIAVALDTQLHEVESESGYMSYIAQRPRAEKHGGHGLFCEADTTDLKAAKAELDAHNGKVWTFIFSLRREDAERLGYNKAAAWQNLLKQESAAIAEAMRIRTDDFRWYAAYHDEGHHPHVHMMVWSTEPEKGYLTREGIAAMRSRMTNAIFHEEMKELYIKKDAALRPGRLRRCGRQSGDGRFRCGGDGGHDAAGDHTAAGPELSEKAAPRTCSCRACGGGGAYRAVLRRWRYV